MTEQELQEAEAQIQKAQEMVSALCKPRGTEGTREWIMSIPAQPDHDPDLVIGAGLRGKQKLVDEVRRLKLELADAAEMLDAACVPCGPCTEAAGSGLPVEHLPPVCGET
jgi:3-deoxy-D-arabino-heptulosonate 7-phosphate (DAHP) synthase